MSILDPTVEELEALAKKIHPRARITWTPYDDPGSPPRDYHVAARVGKHILAHESTGFSNREMARRRLRLLLLMLVPPAQPARHRDDPLPLP